MGKICAIFDDAIISQKIKEKLPYLFQLAEVDNSRDGKLGMEIGTTRERIIIALLIYQFGENNIKTNIPTTKSQIDVIVFDQEFSIKTFSSSKIKGVKIIWTVDLKKAEEFRQNYTPKCDMLLIHINWNGQGGLYLITKKCQQEILEQCGIDGYFNMPKEGTNSRGVEISNKAMELCIEHTSTNFISINWVRKEDFVYDPYERWVDMWR